VVNDEPWTRSKGLHACVGCGLELDADDRNDRCEECVTPPGSRCTCGAGDHRPPGAHNIHCVDPDASATRVIPPERSVDG
jgi:hypothetical protein